jgi:SAM-dependent methyltransferase
MPSNELKKGFQKVVPSLTLQPHNKVEDTLKLLSEGASVCDIGAGGKRITPSTYTIDRFITDNTDLVADIHNMPLNDQCFDGIFCTGTLEHVEDPQKSLSEMYRLLKKDGIIHIEVPFIQGYHADPHDYWRWTLEGLKTLCSKAGFSEIESGSHMGPTSSLNWIVNEYLICVFGNGIFGNMIAYAMRFAFMPLRYLDYLLIRNQHSVRIASGFFFVGRK